MQAALLAARESGCAILLISDDLDEVLLMSDRIAVMYEGRIVGVFDRRDADRERLGLLMGGHAHRRRRDGREADGTPVVAPRATARA